MTTLQVAAILLSLTAVLFTLNQSFLKLPSSLGLMVLSLGSAVGLALMQWLGFSFVGTFATSVLSNIDLSEAVLNGFLCLLLFVGAIHVDIKELWRERVTIGTLATGGVLVSTIAVGTLTWTITSLLGLPVTLVECLIFGALISPTDAVTTLLFLQKTKLPTSTLNQITGESLLNDGMSIDLFGTLLALSYGTGEVSLLTIPFALLWDIAGAIMIGGGLGYLAYLKLRFAPSDNHYGAIITTLALATLSYVAADALGASGPIATVAAGLLLGSHGDTFAGNYEDAHLVSTAWDLIDEILTSILFVIIGLELLAISTQTVHLVAAVMLVPAALAARYTSIYSTLRLLPRKKCIRTQVAPLLTWGGLRGGISIALVLTLPAGEVRDVLMTATYAIVLFSVFVQGPTLAMVAKRLRG